jgi:hypothetical protein
VARERIARQFGDRPALAGAAVVHVRGAATLALHGVHLHAVVLKKVAHDLTGLAGECRTDRHAASERAEHPRLPNPLAARVHVQVGAVGVVLDSHGQQRGGGEDHHVDHSKSS